jgi:hypothetical protein
MGCSSGSLKVKHRLLASFVSGIELSLHALQQSPGFSEAQGPLLHYLLAGWYVAPLFERLKAEFINI